MTVAVPAPTVERLPGPRTAATDAGVTDQLTELVTFDTPKPHCSVVPIVRAKTRRG
jgi:hypothetical protein